MLRRLILWLLGRLHAWTARWLERMQPPEAAVIVRPPRRAGPPAHWRALVERHAPQLLDGDGSHAGVTVRRDSAGGTVAVAGSFEAAAPMTFRPAPVVPGRRTNAPDPEEPPSASVPDVAFSPAWRRRWPPLARPAAARTFEPADATRDTPAGREGRSRHDVHDASPLSHRDHPQHSSSPGAVPADSSPTLGVNVGHEEQTHRHHTLAMPDASTAAPPAWPTLMSTPPAVVGPDRSAPGAPDAALVWPALPERPARSFSRRLDERPRRTRADAEQQGTRWNA